jgi:hypothetical protein
MNRVIRIVIVWHSHQLKGGIPETVIPAPREDTTSPLLTSTLYWTHRRIAKILRRAVRRAVLMVAWVAEAACGLGPVQCELLADLD